MGPKKKKNGKNVVKFTKNSQHSLKQFAFRVFPPGGGAKHNMLIQPHESFFSTFAIVIRFRVVVTYVGVTAIVQSYGD